METLYYNGRIVTMAYADETWETRQMPEAVLVRDGRIAGVGDCETLLGKASRRVRRVDLKGKCLMPGFIDSHGHAALCGQMSMFADLSECESFDDVEACLKAYIARKKVTPKQAVMGFGYDHNFLKENAHPDKRVLDRVSKEIPIFILHVSAHLACANSAALALTGIDETTPDPSGGVVGRLPDSREPSGYLEEAGMQLVQVGIAKKIKIDVPAMLKGVQTKYLENGVTTIQDGATTSRDFTLLRLMSVLGILKLDVVVYPLLSAGGDEWRKKYPAYDGTYKRHLKIGGYKLVLDGSPQGRSAWMSRPYENGEEGYCGYPWLKDEDVDAYVRQAVSEGSQLLAHCNGDAAGDQYLRAYEKAVREIGSGKDLRPVMIHCQTARNDQLDRMAALSMIASIFVGHVWYWGDVHLKNFGEERGHHISPVADALKRGVRVNFHQDPPVTAPNMLHSVWCAVNRQSRNGQTVGADQKVTVYEALKAVTVGGAYQYFEEASKGTVEEGKRADLVILDRCPLDIPPEEIRDIRVMETVKDGKTLWVNPAGED